jgi:hypothetical protein
MVKKYIYPNARGAHIRDPRRVAQLGEFAKLKTNFS